MVVEHDDPEGRKYGFMSGCYWVLPFWLLALVVVVAIVIWKS
jgi:hypothetical protein